MSETFVGVIVVAIIGNAAEHSTAVLVVLKDEELEHFAMLRDAYQPPAKENIVDEVDNLAGYMIGSTHFATTMPFTDSR
jgi:hypothetical protein